MNNEDRGINVVVYEGPFHSEALYQKDIMYQDIADMYSNAMMERYYIVTPWRYITKRYLKFAFVFLLFSAFLFNLFIAALIPTEIVVISQFFKFAKYSENMNVSAKKLIISMGIIIALEIILCAYIRYTLFGIIFV